MENTDETNLEFLPEGTVLDRLPTTVRRMIEEVVGPAYQQLVKEAPTALERTAGRTLIQLMILELCEQHGLDEEIARGLGNSPPPVGAEIEAAMDRFLRVATVKQRTCSFILRAQELRRKHSDASE